MNKGTLVRIRHNEHHGLYISMETLYPYRDSAFVKLYSLKYDRICFDLVRSLEVVDAER